MKALWNLCSKPDSLWCSIIKSKYKCGWREFPTINHKRKGSNFWNGLANHWEAFRSNLVWQPSDGDIIRFWSDKWLIGYDALANYNNNSIKEEVLQLPISHFVSHGEWNINHIGNCLPDGILQIIANTTPTSLFNESDVFTWGGTPDGCFNTKSAYSILNGGSTITTTTTTIFETIWNWRGTERIRTLLWKLGHGTLMTNAERQRRMMTSCNICPNCNLHEETLFHCFRDCRKSLSVWYSLGVKNQNSFFSEQNWKNWIEDNLRKQGRRNEDPYWEITFGVVIDTIWRNRNDWVFSKIHSPVHASIITIRKQVEWMVACIKKKNLMSLMPSTLNEEERVKWKPPPEGCWKLNCDGSVMNNGRSAGCGGVLRDHRGNFVFAFTRRLDPCTTLHAELSGLFHGITIAHNRGFNNLIIETDSMDAFDLVQSEAFVNHEASEIVNSIKGIGNGTLKNVWVRINRDVNVVADATAKRCHIIRDKVVMFEVIPEFLVPLLCTDLGGRVSWPINC